MNENMIMPLLWILLQVCNTHFSYIHSNNNSTTTIRVCLLYKSWKNIWKVKKKTYIMNDVQKCQNENDNVVRKYEFYDKLWL